MNALKAICVAAVLALSLSTTTYAQTVDPGIIHTPGAPAPACGNGSTSLPCDIGSKSSTLTEPEDISSLALMNTLWIVLSIF
jgi:hypothetical protein